MKNYINIIKKSLVLVGSTMLLASCSLNVPPPDQFSDPDAITDVKTGRSLLTSCYLSYPHQEYEFSLLGNDFCPTNLAGKDVETQNLYNWQDKNISNLSSTVWSEYYTCISNCDALLERIDKITTETSIEQQEKKNIKAEAQILKAMCYFDLLRIYATAFDINPDGDGVIIKNMFGYETNARSSKKVCIDMINSLLTEAASVRNQPAKNGWLSQTAAKYMLAETALYMGNYQEAAEHADDVIALGDDSQIGGESYSRLWRTESYSGRIFAFNTSNSYYIGIEYGSNDGDYYAVNPAFSFTDKDVRKEYTLYSKEQNGKMRNLMGKYNMMNKQGTQPSYINRMRFAGAYFIAAEAYARNNNEQMARERINHYLQLISANPIGEEVTGDALIEAILTEKFKEFVGEGTNYFDLKRIHADVNRLSVWGLAATTKIKSNDYRWTFPIPASEYKYNNQVSQNEKWPINR